MKHLGASFKFEATVQDVAAVLDAVVVLGVVVVTAAADPCVRWKLFRSGHEFWVDKIACF